MSMKSRNGNLGCVPLFFFAGLAWMVSIGSDECRGEDRLICAGWSAVGDREFAAAAKPAQTRAEGMRRALVVFARFQGEDDPGVPDWAGKIFDPEHPGSFSHFFDTMSLGRLQVRGEVAPRVYESTQPAGAYLADDPDQVGAFGRFSLEVLRQVDAEVDFSRFDSDGPDGVPDSGDDDGRVDAVFIVVPSAPAGFVIGAATGVADLGFGEGRGIGGVDVQGDHFITDDLSVEGDPIRISAYLGTVQRGRTFAEAVGSMCHEYGHILGLPDLYDIDFLRQEGARPEEDSAGIGAWGLMGWGALGWNGDDGPNSLCAWSRSRLGWAQVTEPEQAQEVMELEEVGRNGQVYEIPLDVREHFLVEYRRRMSSFYDRHIPGEGLLIWHVEQTEPDGSYPLRWRVDLECADGRWRDGGFPLSEEADPVSGGDNLDFWAHDVEYARQHGGNLGDATDPFDGVRFQAFTAGTNPAASSNDGQVGVWLENVRLAGDLARADVRANPPVIEIVDLTASGEKVAAGAPVSVIFRLINQGGMRATGLRARLKSDDPLVEILEEEVVLGELGIGERLWVQEFPQLRLSPDLEEPHAATVALEIYSYDQLLARRELTLTGVPVHRVTGVVQGESGEALAGIPIHVTSYNSTYEAGVYFSKRTVSDENGAFELNLPSGRYHLYVQPDPDSRWGEQNYYDVSIQEDAEIEFTLPWAFFLTGVVHDPDGNPVGKQMVQISSQDGAYGYFISVSTQVDGTYRLKLPKGDYTIATYSGAAAFSQVVGEIRLDEDRVFDIQVESGAELTFHVVDEQGTDLENVRIAVQFTSTGSEETTVTRSNGQVTMSVVPGVYTVCAHTPPSPFLPDDPFDVEVTQDTTVEMILQRGLLVAGSLVDENGSAVRQTGKVVLVREDGSSSYEENIGPDGRFSLGVEAGRYRARADFSQDARGISSPGQIFPDQILGVIEVREDTKIDFAIESGIDISGQVAAEDGRLVDGNSLLWFDPVGGGHGGTGVWISSSGQYVVSLLPGMYWVYAELYGSMDLPSFQELGQVSVMRDTVLHWTLGRGELFRGRIVDAEGQGIPYAFVYATSFGSRLGNRGDTDVDGLFSLRLFPGIYSLYKTGGAGSSSIRWNLGEIEVPTAGVIEVRQPAGAILQGEVADARGRSVAVILELLPGPFRLRDMLEGKALVSVYGSSQFDIELAPGRYAVVATGGRNGNVSWVLDDVVVEGEVRMDVVLPGMGDTHWLTGQVKCKDGEVPEGAFVYFYDARQGIVVLGIAQENLDGRYRVELPAGVYQVTVGKYEDWRITEVYEYGSLEVTGDRTWDVVLGDDTAVVDESQAMLMIFELWQNYPNPFNALTVIAYQLPGPADVELTIYNIMGQKVKTLVREGQEPGIHSVEWDGADTNGRAVGSGVYLYRLRAGDFLRTRRLVLIK